jgi:hypothetical protein
LLILGAFGLEFFYFLNFVKGQNFSKCQWKKQTSRFIVFFSSSKYNCFKVIKEELQKRTEKESVCICKAKQRD